MIDHLEGLNEAQLLAVTSSPGPLRVVAGPGSGKTRAVVSRIVDLVRCRGSDPSRILAVTFTKMAAEEMRTRLTAALGVGASSVWLGTFHSVAARLIRVLGPGHVGLTPRFTIYDDDRKRTVRDVLREIALEDASKRVEAGTADEDDRKAVASRKAKVKADDVERVLRLIEGARNLRLDARRMREIESISPGDTDVFARYDSRLAAANAVDFGLLLCRILDFSESVHTTHAAASLFDHVFVDEFQDANRVQVEIAYFLARRTRSITVVGDPDQSLYQWRGAERAAILRFQRDWGEAALTVRLERNYRSTGNIVAAAREFIASNPGRVPMSILTDAAAGSQIRVVALEDGRKEAEHVVARVGALAKEGTPLGQIAVLYRSNALCREIERAVRRASMPYRIVKGLRFYDRRIVKDALCWMRLALNPSDDSALDRVANVPTRGVSDRTLAVARRWAFAHDACLADGLRALVDGRAPAVIKKRAATSVSALLDILALLIPAADMPPSVALALCLHASGMRDTLSKSVVEIPGSADADEEEDDDEDEDALTPRARAARDLRQLDEIAEDVLTYEETASAEERTLQGFLNHAALLSESDEAKGDRLQIMTVHASKGREYDAVFVVGMEDGVFPSSRSIQEQTPKEQTAMRVAAGREDESLSGGRAIDEEQRLCYVALTRARKQATFTYVRERFMFGDYRVNEPSRFIDALMRTGRCAFESQRAG